MSWNKKERKKSPEVPSSKANQLPKNELIWVVNSIILTPPDVNFFTNKHQEQLVQAKQNNATATETDLPNFQSLQVNLDHSHPNYIRALLGFLAQKPSLSRRLALPLQSTFTVHVWTFNMTNSSHQRSNFFEASVQSKASHLQSRLLRNLVGRNGDVIGISSAEWLGND